MCVCVTCVCVSVRGGTCACVSKDLINRKFEFKERKIFDCLTTERMFTGGKQEDGCVGFILPWLSCYHFSYLFTQINSLFLTLMHSWLCTHGHNQKLSFLLPLLSLVSLPIGSACFLTINNFINGFHTMLRLLWPMRLWCQAVVRPWKIVASLDLTAEPFVVSFFIISSCIWWLQFWILIKF